MRLAFVGPLPPAPTGIADYDVDVLHALAGRHEIDAWHDGVGAEGVPAGIRARPASQLLATHARTPYDAVVYQMGNGPAHAFLYPLLHRLPGLLVLHDLVLHHARARMLLDGAEARAYRADPSRSDLRDAARARADEYRAEAAYSHPEAGTRLAEAHLATVGMLLPYAYPLVRLPVEASRAVAAHNDWTVDWLRAHVPGVPASRVVMPVTALRAPDGAAAALRARFGIAPDDVVVGCFGLLTPEKQVTTVARAVARAAALRPRLRLLLVGASPDPAALDRTLVETGVAHRTTVTGRVPFDDLAAAMEAADIVAHLRYPTARETSAALLRVLAQGRATVMTGLEHQRDIPDDAVLRLDPSDEEGGLTRALLHLADLPARRRRLGEAAAAFVAREHTPARCAASYEDALRVAATATPPPRPDWPSHLVAG